MGEAAIHQRREMSHEPLDDSLVGKLKLHCPSFYNSLSALEMLSLNTLASPFMHLEPLGSEPLEFDSSYSPPTS